jgi:hypothetical protein
MKTLKGHLVVLLLAVGGGLAITWIDTRPGWDDSGVTAGLLLLCSGALALVVPRRVWLIALAVGIWIPLYAIAKHGVSRATLGMLLVLLFPLAGAYGALAIRKLAAAGTAKAPS